ncbi:hypothetical protein BJX96DRAFT_164207 [Aspergillus floccosus]
MAHPRSSIIPLRRMPQQVGVQAPEDDWTGVINRTERRKLQNRLNQRLYRLRKRAKKREAEIDAPASSVPEPASNLLALVSPDQTRVENTDDLECTHAPPNALQLRRCLEAAAYQAYLRGAPNRDHLISLSRLNVHRAINENIEAIGMTSSWMKSDDSISIFNLTRPGFTGDGVPSSLLPTPVQRAIPHHPWLDFFPFPHMRDLLIMAGDSIDDDDLCHDLMAFWDSRNTSATLLVWGQPWDPKSWEVTETFAGKWGWLLHGSPELLASTNFWRKVRGEAPLIWRNVLQYQELQGSSVYSES